MTASTSSRSPAGLPVPSATPRSYLYTISRDEGATWGAAIEASAQAFYPFSRVIDGYPSAAALADYRVAVKAVSVAGVQSVDWLIVSIDTSGYLGWTPTAPSAGIRASNRAILWDGRRRTTFATATSSTRYKVCKAIKDRWERDPGPLTVGACGLLAWSVIG